MNGLRRITLAPFTCQVNSNKKESMIRKIQMQRYTRTLVLAELERQIFSEFKLSWE